MKVPDGESAAKASHYAPLGDQAIEAIQAIETCLAYLHWRMPRPPLWLRPWQAARWDPGLQDLYGLLRDAAAELARLVIRGGAERALRTATEQLVAATLKLPVVESQLEPHIIEALDNRDELMHHLAVSRYCASAAADYTASGDSMGLYTPLENREADMKVVPGVLETVYAWAMQHPVLRWELTAARWYFGGWAGPVPPTAPVSPWKARLTRELEFLLLDRPSLLWGETPLVSFLRLVPPSALDPRERSVLMCHLDSLPGIWIVKRRRGVHVTVENIFTSSELPLYEHRPEPEYNAHDYFFGRVVLQPSGDLARSAGAVVWRPANAGAARSLAEHSKRHLEKARVAACISEAAINWLFHPRASIPDYSQPALSAADALRIRREFLQTMIDHGVTRMVSMVDDDGRPTGEIDSAMQGDVAVFMWLQALEEQRDAG